MICPLLSSHEHEPRWSDGSRRWDASGLQCIWVAVTDGRVGGETQVGAEHLSCLNWRRRRVASDSRHLGCGYGRNAGLSARGTGGRPGRASWVGVVRRGRGGGRQRRKTPRGRRQRRKLLLGKLISRAEGRRGWNAETNVESWNTSKNILELERTEGRERRTRPIGSLSTHFRSRTGVQHTFGTFPRRSIDHAPCRKEGGEDNPHCR